ncbi:MAG: hypothetical protein JWM28_1458 [Chitinophagaceae bacterium]|nr:hypothetical protein [Chitinophagaceae bacterium]
MTSGYYMVVLSTLILSFLFWKEWKRKNKGLLFQRLLASLLAVGCLLFLAYPDKPGTSSKSTKNLVVVTSGLIHDSLKHFLQQKKEPLPFFSTDRSLDHAVAGIKMQFITDLNSFAEKYKDDTLHVFGNGFNKEELDLLHEHSIIFHANPVVSSITSVFWKRQLKTGEPLIVQGRYENVSAHEIKILLQAFNETVDSAIIPAKTNPDFSLHTIPKNSGKAVYSLVALAATDTLQNEPVPLEVSPGEPLKILFLSSSPDFENTFLKSHLSQHGYAVAIRTTISKNKSGAQFLNMPELPGNQITNSFLGQFDLLIADDDALQEINASGLSAFREAIERHGLGLIVKLNNEKNKSSFYSRLFPVHLIQPDKKLYSFIHSVFPDSNSYKIKIEEPVSIRYQPGTQILLQDQQSNIFASGAMYGNGKIVATTLNNTFSLALSGNLKAYQTLWSFLLQEAAKKIVPAETWRIYPAFPLVNEPVQLQLETSNPGTPQGRVGDSKLYLKQRGLLPWQWEGIYWPVEDGWQSLLSINGTVEEWYVYKNSDWKKLFNFQKTKETKKYEAHHPVSFVQGKHDIIYNWTAYLPFSLLILFFICCAFLWIEQKSK